MNCTKTVGVWGSAIYPIGRPYTQFPSIQPNLPQIVVQNGS